MNFNWGRFDVAGVTHALNFPAENACGVGAFKGSWDSLNTNLLNFNSRIDMTS